MVDKKDLKSSADKREKGSFKKLPLVTVLGKKDKVKYPKEVSDYIYKMLRMGYNEKDVRNALLSVGWPKEFIEKEFLRIKGISIKKRYKRTRYFFGRLLFILIMFMMIIVYILLIFNKFFIGVNYSRFVFLYIIFGILLISWVILLHPFIVHAKMLYERIRDIRKQEKIRMLLEKRRRESLLYGAKFEKEKRKAERLKLKEEIRRLKEKERERRKVIRLELKEEKRKRREERKGRGIFSRLFRRKPEEKREELKAGKEKIPALKRKEEEKVFYKRIKIERKKLRIFYFILFLLSIVGAIIAYLFYKNIIAMVIALILMILSLFGFIKIRKPKEEISEGEKVAVVKKLPSRPRIELGRYETDLDVLYRLIEQRGAIKLPAISKYFGIDRKKAEEWATILQDHNLAEIRYPAIGEPELIKSGLSKAERKALLKQQKMIAKKFKEVK